MFNTTRKASDEQRKLGERSVAGTVTQIFAQERDGEVHLAASGGRDDMLVKEPLTVDVRIVHALGQTLRESWNRTPRGLPAEALISANNVVFQHNRRF